MHEEMVTRNPCWKVTRLSEKNVRDRVLSQEEWKRLIKVLPRHAADIVTKAYHTGMRAEDAKQALNLMEGYFGNTGQPTTAILLQEKNGVRQSHLTP